MAFSSTTGSKRKNEDLAAFDGIAPSASTSASKLMKKPSYDVFINHRGPDVKSTLASVLYGILTGMALSVFLDSEELEYGDFLPQTIEAAMKGALLHIAIFSERYAESSWCLEELASMLKTGATIIPIFYHVEPTDLRYINQGKGIYVDAFKKHVRKGRYSLTQLQEWKKALHVVSFYSGQIIKTQDDEMRLLKNIVRCVLKEINNNVPLEVAKHPVGLKEIVEDFEMNTLQPAQCDQDVQIVGIWGMSGSGKTTLAKELYNKISSSMERSSFVFDVRDAATKGLLHEKQKKLLNDLGVRGLAFNNIKEGVQTLSTRLRSVRALIVLDDVDHAEQLDALLPAKESLGGCSLIVVTAREYKVLKSWGITSLYKMRALDPFHAEQLFCWHAFMRSSPPDGFEELVKMFLEACDGLPLSLKVFGGQLYGEFRREYWESLLKKIWRIFSLDIKQKLKVSYDALDNEEKEMFLDTACFFIGERTSLAIEVWNGSGWSGLHGWERLLNKCLVELDNNNCIRMHGELRDLGRELANQHSPSRLGLCHQMINVAGKQTEKRSGIRGIKAVERRPPYGGELMAEISGILLHAPSLVGIKLFVIRGDYLNQATGEVSRELVWLRWFQIRQRNLPARLSWKNLRVLELYEDDFGEHHFEELWEADSEAPLQLRQLVISSCYNFQSFPNSIGCLNELKRIEVTSRNNVSSLPEEFCLLQSLEHLELCSCAMLSSLPCSFGDLRNLQYLSLSNCTNLRRLPVTFKNLMHLQYLNLAGCGQLILTSEDFQNITKLRFLSLSGCKQLEELPRHITNQASLRELYLDGVKRIRELPINIGRLSKLRKMRIGSDYLTSFPNSLGDLSSLTDLSIEYCLHLECLPFSLGDLSSLTDLSIEYCPNLESLPASLGDLVSLTTLEIRNCPKPKFLPFSLGCLNLLEDLVIAECPISHVDFGAASLPFALSNLKRISLTETEVCRISISEDRYPCLESLFLYNNHLLTEIETLPATVKSLGLGFCEMLKIIRVIGALVNLKDLHIMSCPELDELPSFAHSTALRSFELKGCYGIEKIEGLEYCTRLERLTVDTCWEVPGIQSLGHMERLRELELRANKGSAIERCIQTIQKWPDVIMICTRAVSDASSLVNYLHSPNLVVVDSISNQKIESWPTLKQKRSSNGDATVVCFVINCVSSQRTLHLLWSDGFLISEMKIHKGRWVWVGVFTQRSRNECLAAEEIKIIGYGGECEKEDEVEKGLVVRGEEQTLVEAVRSLLPLLQS